LLPDTDEAGAQIALEALRRRLLAAMSAGGWPVSASIGAISFEQAPAHGDLVLRRADALMYAIKRSSRDGVRCESAQGWASSTNSA
ncbi:MAG: hypothetical protein KC457_18465, partial [Myxococcales bacterium]|nr:hypothetical protein [Myxococcales bacterium]